MLVAASASRASLIASPIIYSLQMSSLVCPQIRSAVDLQIEVFDISGADYSVSQTSTDRVSDGVSSTMLMMNAEFPEEIAFASSSTQAVENLARAIEQDVLVDEEIIITGEHEST